MCGVTPWGNKSLSSRRAVGCREDLEKDGLEGWVRRQRIPGGWIPKHRAKTVLRRKGQLRVPNAMELSTGMRDEN